MNNLEYKMLDIIYNYKGLASVKDNNTTYGLPIDSIPKEEFLKNVNTFCKFKYIKSFYLL